MANKQAVADHLLSTRTVGRDAPLSAAAIYRLKMTLRLPPVVFPERAEGYVYFVGKARGPVKIGYSNDPLRRLAHFQTATHERLHLLAVAPGCREIEKALHSFYAGERMKGEWFKRSKRLRFLIDEINARFAQGWSSHSSAQFVREVFA